jgi:hypothetical protein
MFKEDSEGTTHCCDHETTNPSGICNVCLGNTCTCDHYKEECCEICLPMPVDYDAIGIDKWKAIGEKYGYFKYFNCK